MRSDLIDICVVLLRETDRAWHVDHGGEDPAWLPKSQCELERNTDGKSWTLTCSQQLATEKGLL
jgi:hypothetical protein